LKWKALFIRKWWRVCEARMRRGEGLVKEVSLYIFNALENLILSLFFYVECELLFDDDGKSLLVVEWIENWVLGMIEEEEGRKNLLVFDSRLFIDFSSTFLLSSFFSFLCAAAAAAFLTHTLTQTTPRHKNAMYTVHKNELILIPIKLISLFS
jgi:hypothetical protein